MNTDNSTRSNLEMKFLVLYVFKHLTEPITLEQLTPMVVFSPAIDYFEFCQAVNELVESGHLTHTDGMFELTAKGTFAADVCQSGIPYSARMRAQNSTLTALAKMRRETEVCSSVSETDGEITVNCQLLDGQTAFLDIKLFAVSPEQASALRENFNKNAEKIYNKILESFMESD